jgi:L-alanine-DL-glutamate epimerase-like enolase superfamily enzyme
LDLDRRQFLKRVAGASATAAALGTSPQGRAGLSADEAGLDIARANRQLAEHRIADITSRRLVDEFPRLVGPSSIGGPVGRGGATRARIITTDRGVTGWCLGGGQQVDPKPFIGAKVGDMFDVGRGKADDIPGWLDKTLHDLAARILGVPVWKMLGAKGPREVWLYSGAIYMDDVIPEERPRGIKAVIDACRQDYEAGYRAFKLKIGRGRKWMFPDSGLVRDIAVTRAVRETFPDCRILVDANDAYTVVEASKYIAGVADCDLYWFEEAFEENADDYRRLREAMDRFGCEALIADGESLREEADPASNRFGAYSNAFIDHLFELAEEKLVDIFLMDLDSVGYSQWRRVMPELVAAGVPASPHTWRSCLRPYYAAHLCGGVGNIPIVEGIPGRIPGVDLSNYSMRDGHLVLPDAPGFGLELAG